MIDPEVTRKAENFKKHMMEKKSGIRSAENNNRNNPDDESQRPTLPSYRKPEDNQQPNQFQPNMYQQQRTAANEGEIHHPTMMINQNEAQAYGPQISNKWTPQSQTHDPFLYLMKHFIQTQNPWMIPNTYRSPIPPVTT